MENFTKLIERFGETLKTNGFKKAGLYYRLKKWDNTGLLNIQKSMGSTATSVKFTMNVGIHFRSLFLFSSGETVSRPIITNDCQWHNRIGLMMPVKRDHWWTIDEYSDTYALAEELSNIFTTHVYPVISANISDQDYMNNLVANNVPGATILGRLVDLSTLFCIYNNPGLPGIMQELKEYCEKNRLRDLYLGRMSLIENYAKERK